MIDYSIDRSMTTVARLDGASISIAPHQTDDENGIRNRKEAGLFLVELHQRLLLIDGGITMFELRGERAGSAVLSASYKVRTLEFDSIGVFRFSAPQSHRKRNRLRRKATR